MEIKRLALLCSAMMLALASCDHPSADQTPPRMAVFATIYPLAEIAHEIGGDSVSMDWLIEQGKLLTGFVMTQRERDRMIGTDLILCDGFHRTEIWAAPDLVQRQNLSNVLSLENIPATLSPDYPGEGLLLLDPQIVAQFVPKLTEAMIRIRPRRADEFRAAASSFSDQLSALIAKYPPAKPGMKVIVLSTTWNPLLYRAGIKPVLVDSDVYRFTDTDARAVRSAAASSGIATIIVPFDVPAGAVNRIEQLTGLSTLPLDSAGLAGLKGHDTYLAIAQYNLQQLSTLAGK